MKNKFKNLLTYCFLAILFFSSCEKEIYDNAESQSQQSKNLNIQKIKYSELKSNKKIIEKLKKVASKKLPTTIAQRAVYNEDFGVLIDTTNIVKMVSDTEQSFTFSIVNYSDSSKIENLVLVSKNDDSFEAYITEYNLTQQELNLIANGGSLINIVPINISEIDATSKEALAGGSCVSVSTTKEFICNPVDGGESYSFGYSYSGGCNGTMTYLMHNVVSIDMACLSSSSGGGGSSTGNTGDSGSSGNNTNGTNGTTTGTTGVNGGYTTNGGYGNNGTGSNNTNPVIINTTYIPCTSCLVFSTELGNFTSDLDTTLLNTFNDLDIRDQQQIVNYLDDNNYAVTAIEIVNLVLTDLMNDDCAILPTFLNPTLVSAPYDPDIFGDYPVPTVQQDHDAIQQQFNNLRNTSGNLAAVNYLITTYNMNTFDTKTITFNYTITFENGLSNGADANAIRGYTNSIMTSCNLEIDINLFSSVDFGYITRVIKHELLHILQGIEYGQNGASVALQEFDAYYLQIFGFNNLKKIQNASIQYDLAKKMIENMKQLTTFEKQVCKKQIDKVKLYFPELCK